VRILALEREKSGASPDDFALYFVDEAKKVYQLYLEQVIREHYFRADAHSAVLVLECADLTEAGRKLSQLPLVSAGLIEFDLIPLVPYSGYSRLLAG